jgi:hypothetical protein
MRTAPNCGFAGSGRLAPPSTQLPCVSRLVLNCARAAPLREVRQPLIRYTNRPPSLSFGSKSSGTEPCSNQGSPRLPLVASHHSLKWVPRPSPRIRLGWVNGQRAGPEVGCDFRAKWATMIRLIRGSSLGWRRRAGARDRPCWGSVPLSRKYVRTLARDRFRPARITARVSGSGVPSGTPPA